MRVSCCLLCVFLLSSCVYYSAQRDFEIGNKHHKSVCDTGSKKEKSKCRADLRRLKEEIIKQN